MLYPFAIVIGVEPGRDARRVAKLIGKLNIVKLLLPLSDSTDINMNRTHLSRYVSAFFVTFFKDFP